jgi:5-methylcytosine-specific restriction endonuclease McrA
MPTKIQVLRLQVFQNQRGRCCYCGVQMWRLGTAGLPGIPKRNARVLQCTAEHLTPRSEGGEDIADNLVAACAHCNHTRHKRKNPPPPNAYLADIRKRVARGAWHPGWVWSLGLLSRESVCDTHAKTPTPG